MHHCTTAYELLQGTADCYRALSIQAQPSATQICHATPCHATPHHSTARHPKNAPNTTHLADPVGLCVNGGHRVPVVFTKLLVLGLLLAVHVMDGCVDWAWREEVGGVAAAKPAWQRLCCCSCCCRWCARATLRPIAHGLLFLYSQRVQPSLTGGNC